MEPTVISVPPPPAPPVITRAPPIPPEDAPRRGRTVDICPWPWPCEPLRCTLLPPLPPRLPVPPPNCCWPWPDWVWFCPIWFCPCDPPNWFCEAVGRGLVGVCPWATTGQVIPT